MATATAAAAAAGGCGDDYEYADTCRLCLSKEGRQCAVFGPGAHDKDVGPLSARIFSCLSIDISQYDDLPKQICHRCECQINVWYYFKVECEMSQRKLADWIGAHPRCSAEKEAFIEQCRSLQESVNIKLELPEEELHTDQHINSMYVDVGQTHESDESNSSHSAFVHNLGILDRDPLHPSNESDDSLNLVISGATSVDPSVHEGFSVANDEQLQALHTPEVILTEDSTIIRDNEIYPNSPMSSEGWHNEEDFQRDLLEEISSPFARSVAVKSEPKEPGARAGITLRNLLLGSKSAPSIRPLQSFSLSNQNSSLTSTKTSSKKRMKSLSLGPKSKKPRLSENSFNYYRVPNSSLELPKLSNDVYDENTSTCKICVKKFTYLNNLWRHVKATHSKEHPFRCGVCRKDFSGRRELIAHRLGTINKYCRLGKKPEAKNLSLITNNPKIKTGNHGKYGCNECKLKFRLFVAAQAHERIHTGEKPFICFKCNEREFRLRKTAIRHVATCKGRNHFPDQTSKEDNKPVSADDVKLPQEDHQPVSPVPVKVPKTVLHNVVKKTMRFKLSKCPKCGKVFTNGVGLSNHLRVNCSRKCTSCLKSIPSKIFVKHYRLCIQASRGSSAPSESVSVNADKMHPDNASSDVKCEEKSETDVSEDSKDESSPAPRKLKRFDMTVADMWSKQVNRDGSLKSLTCLFCGRTSASRKLLHRHVSIHSRFYKSGANDLDLGSNEKVVPVLKTRPAGKFPGFKRPKLKCDICMKLFTTASSLEYHKLTHKKVKCEKCLLSIPASLQKTHLCSSKVKTELLLQLPSNELSAAPEKGVIQYTCHLCKKKFHTRKMLYQHKKMHIKVKIYKCKMCNNSYSDAGALKAHKEVDHKDELEEASKKDLVQNGSLGDQLSLDHSSEKLAGKPLYCYVCHKGYSTEGSLQRHMKLHEPSGIHAIQKPSDPGVFYCNICGKACKSIASFAAHKGWHSRASFESNPKSEAVVSSDDTLDLFKSPEPPKISDATEVNGLEPAPSYSCSLCPKKFTAPKNLSIHMHYHKNPKLKSPKEPKIEAVNDNETAHKCEICLSTFSDLSALSSHMETHTEKSSEALIAPQESEPPKQELLHCKLCNKEYKNKKNLNYHMMGHSGEKPYKCKSCSNQYSNPKALSKHEKERHAVVLHPFSCNRCKISFLLREDLLGHQEKCPH